MPPAGDGGAAAQEGADGGEEVDDMATDVTDVTEADVASHHPVPNSSFPPSTNTRIWACGLSCLMMDDCPLYSLYSIPSLAPNFLLSSSPFLFLMSACAACLFVWPCSFGGSR